LPEHEEIGDVGLYIARRLLALIVDLVGVSILLATTIHFALLHTGNADAHAFSTFFKTVLFTGIGLFLYLWLSEWWFSSTLGKALFSLAVVNLHGGRNTALGTLLRNLFLPFDLLLVGFVLATLTHRRRRLGDLIAGTAVMNARIGMLAPAIAVVVLGGLGYLDFAYAEGWKSAQNVSDNVQLYGPSLFLGQPTPSPLQPTPSRTAVPTEQPITVPTIAPSAETIASPTPGGGLGNPTPGVSPASAATPAAGGGAGATPTPAPIATPT
jgi:uncharacterized RDD family membrane protein YckC